MDFGGRNAELRKKTQNDEVERWIAEVRNKIGTQITEVGMQTTEFGFRNGERGIQDGTQAPEVRLPVAKFGIKCWDTDA